MPVHNWFKLHEDNGLKWLHKKGKSRPLGNIAYKILQNSFIKEFGFDSVFLSDLQKRIQIARYKAKIALTGDTSDQIFIDVLTQELEIMSVSGKKNSYIDTVIYVEKFMGFKLDLKNTTVKEFYSYIRSINGRK